ncbi:hypothetical protein [Actinomadura madurae]|uniref:hypothetical protein n=1 Tax=Actinomadura madurae TaxID=1993 RepID=UPI0020270B66|nr:hypothetical protein [Actinomadura madurae]MCP9952154.1 hypothetical protein [Actinomadura madurae]MCP9981386.1 hypothetical protein [Actinomadura madurae]MCQ0007104.1 hypothetical protein [Actinomadura madurae]MCQ0017589.1 hypothetical protein [Actinomadura madurae]URM97685.1 hypothetical protein LUW76_26805 [Actinomadura madurae]
MSDTTKTSPAVFARAADPAVGRWAGGAVLVSVTAALAVLLTRAEDGLPHVLPGYTAWQDEMYANVPQFLRWWVGDATEAEFFKSAIGGLGMIAGGWLAHAAWRRGRRWAGFPISYGTGLWPWLLGSAAIGLLLSDLAWGWTIQATGQWQPTFVPFVSVPPAVVLVYGAGWSVAATGAVLGAALTTPVALAVANYFCHPLHLPNVIGNVTGMWVGALLAFLICRHLPWMPRPLATEQSSESAETAEPPAPEQDERGGVWVVRRVLADFTEAQFYGNEIAAIGLIGGTLATYLLNPLTPVYGSGLLPAMLTAQVLAGTLGVLLYQRRWAVLGWYPTFVPVVSVAPAVVLTYGATVQAVVLGAVFGAVAGPPLAALVSRRLPPDFHPFIGNVVSMTVCTLIAVPVLGLLPGFVSTL